MKAIMRTALVYATATVSFGLLGGYAQAAPSNATPDCGSSFNPYDYTQTALSGCGIQTSLSTTETALPGGGTQYSYVLPNNQGTAQIVVPPANFDPVDATAAQLAEYDLPTMPNPSDLQAMINWQGYVSQLKHPMPAPPFLAQSKISADQTTNAHWSGYAVNPSGTYSSALMDWTEPSYGTSVCSSTASVIWPGIGGYSDNDLGQDGTAWSQNVGIGLSQHQAWWEVLPQIASVQPLNLIIPAGDTAGAITNYSNGAYTGDVVDGTTGNYQVWSYADNTYSGSSAEFIAERPLLTNGSFTNLSAFGTLTVTTPEANYQNLNGFSATGGRHGIQMMNGNDVLATPNTVNSNNVFTDTQHHCN